MPHKEPKLITIRPVRVDWSNGGDVEIVLHHSGNQSSVWELTYAELRQLRDLIEVALPGTPMITYSEILQQTQQAVRSEAGRYARVDTLTAQQLDDVTTLVLREAVAVIRAQVAEQIEADAGAGNWAKTFAAGMRHAAQIARGAWT